MSYNAIELPNEIIIKYSYHVNFLIYFLRLIFLILYQYP